MQNLIEKAEANAQRLLCIKVDSDHVGLGKYRHFLKVESHRLKIEHRAGGSGLALVRARSKMLDLIVRSLHREILQIQPQPEEDESRIAVVAYGGYGRGELNPHSDLDVMILHNQPDLNRSQKHQWLVDFCHSFFLSLTDIRLKILPVTRSIEDCIKVAGEDVQSKTALIETRLIAGDDALFDQMQQSLLAHCVLKKERAYIAARVSDQRARRQKYGNSPYLQEPDIKSGCGGLRDYQNLLWMAFFKRRCRSMDDLLKKKIIDKSEYRQLTAAYDYLLRVRNEMHYLTGLPSDVLRRSLQPKVAFHLGFKETSPSKRLERFMHRVYLHLRTIYLLSKTLEDRMAIFSERGGLQKLSRFFNRRKWIRADGFEFASDQIHLTHSNAFNDHPRRLMKVFRHAQQHNLTLSPDLAYAIRSQLHLADHAFIGDAKVQKTFIEILKQKGKVARILRLMHELGLLGKFIPEFGKMTGKVQHEFYHAYTADEHSILCVEELDRIWQARQTPYRHYTHIFERQDRVHLLYLSLILHDTGKASDRAKDRTKDHSKEGAKISLRIGKRLGLDANDLCTLCFLIEEHRTMVATSQRRDLDDPAVVKSFSTLLKTAERADLLTLHCFADSMGTSSAMWNAFKDGLLRNLHSKICQTFSDDSESPFDHQNHKSELRKKVETILPLHLQKDEVDAHFDHLPDRYFRNSTADQIMADLDRVHQFMHHQMQLDEPSHAPILNWQAMSNRGYSRLQVITWDYASVFSKLCAALTASGINILSAHIFSRSDGIILDTFFVVDALDGGLVGKSRRAAFCKNVTSILMNATDPDCLVAKAPKLPPLYQSLEDEQIKTRIAFDNEGSDRRTIIDVETEDRVGLLYVISKVLAEMQLDLSIAKITTERGAAMDSFYVKNAFGEKIKDRSDQMRIATKLMQAIHQINLPDAHCEMIR